MAQRAAIASGNWSNPAIWNAGVLPGPGDVVGSNNFTVTIDQNINVERLTNAAVSLVTIVPVMTSNTTPSGIAASSGVWTNNPTYEAWTAFNSTQFGYLANVGPFWLSYEFPTSRAVSNYAIGATTSGSMRDWTFEGWNGVSWVVLHTVTNYLAASWSSSGYTSPDIGNTTAYIRYRFNCTAVNTGSYVQMSNVRLFEVYSTALISGGGFILNDGVTVTCTDATNGIAAGAATCLTITAISPAVVNLNANITSSVTSIIKSGNCTLNVTGLLQGNNNAALSLNTNTGITNIVGEIRKSGGSISNVGILNTGTGNTINITGDLTYTGGLGGGNIKKVLTSSGSCNINITGNLIGSLMSSSGDFILIAGTNDTINITGNILGTAGFVNGTATITGGAFYLNVIGQIIGGSGGPAINITNTSAIIILTGPFISHESGIQPLYVARMHYRRTIGSYYEFRDSSTNGALPPAAAAPATRLNSPEVGSDLPVVTDVRFGTTYGYGSLVGTVRMPTANQVTYGVAVDNTFGAAVLTAASVWDYLVDNITTANSIGSRLKNVSTPQTVGSQLASLL
jgi:hypothetical protein